MEQFKENEIILFETDYDSKLWEVAGIFDENNPDHYSDGKTNRCEHSLSKKEAERLNSYIDGDGCRLIVGIIITSKGIRIRPL